MSVRAKKRKTRLWVSRCVLINRTIHVQNINTHTHILISSSPSSSLRLSSVVRAYTRTRFPKEIQKKIRKNKETSDTVHLSLPSSLPFPHLILSSCPLTLVLMRSCQCIYRSSIYLLHSLRPRDLARFLLLDGWCCGPIRRSGRSGGRRRDGFFHRSRGRFGGS